MRVRNLEHGGLGGGFCCSSVGDGTAWDCCSSGGGVVGERLVVG